MAKSDSFFIRQFINVEDDGTYRQADIDLGAYVDALGKSVLRIHNIAINYSDINGRTPDVHNSASASADFQLLTQSQSDMVIPGDNKSVVASGRLSAVNQEGADGVPSIVSNDLDVAPQHWTNGYLVGVETMYFGGAASSGWAEDVYISITMECTVETLSQAAAMSLALSQQ